MFKNIKKILYRNLDNREITYKKMKEIICKNKSTILLDVRSSQEFKEGHLEGAINIPLFDLEKSEKKELENKKQTIIIYCSTGNRSRKAKEILDELGYEDVYNLRNGLDGII